MKRYSFLFFAVLLVCACSKDDDDIAESDIFATYSKVISGIDGTWVLDAWYNPWNIDSLRIEKGWDRNLTYYKYLETQKQSWYNYYGYGQYNTGYYDSESFADKRDWSGEMVLTFREGRYYDKQGKGTDYSLRLEQNKSVLCGDDGTNWPFAVGAVLLEAGNYLCYIEIKSDGMLYFYHVSNTSVTSESPFGIGASYSDDYISPTIGDGVPLFRYQRK